MTAQVAVQVEQLENALQVPIQAVVEKGGRHFCLLTRDGEHFEPCEVAVGSNNTSSLSSSTDWMSTCKWR